MDFINFMDFTDPLIHDRHLIDQILCICHFVHDEQHIAGIQVDTSLQVFLEIDISGHCLRVTIESGSDQLAISVDYRRTGVTSRNIIIRDKVYGDIIRTVTTEILSVIQVFLFLRYFKFSSFRTFFLHNTRQRRVIIIEHGISRFVTLHVTVSQTDR